MNWRKETDGSLRARLQSWEQLIIRIDRGGYRGGIKREDAVRAMRMIRGELQDREQAIKARLNANL
jgi:hypothetical protein